MNDFLEPFTRMLETTLPPGAVRAAERGQAIDGIWTEIEASGFLDALVPEAMGGAGLTLGEVGPLWHALGRHAVALPVGETMIARGLLAAACIGPPDGPIALAVAPSGSAVTVPGGLVAKHLLLESAGALHLIPVSPVSAELTGVHGSLAARIHASPGARGELAALPPPGLRGMAAVLRASLIAGAIARLVEMTTDYANERTQFGKPIGRQQALQQSLAVMAEDMVAARIASQLGCAAGFLPSLAAAATAKSVAGAAAARVVATAHAVHGAIGISEEHDLQLFTRRLHEWRLADGSEGYWNRRLGTLLLECDEGAVDFVRIRSSD